MSRRYTPEQIISMLREAEVALAASPLVKLVARSAYRSRVSRADGGLQLTRPQKEHPSPEGDLGSDLILKEALSKPRPSPAVC